MNLGFLVLLNWAARFVAQFFLACVALAVITLILFGTILGVDAIINLFL